MVLLVSEKGCSCKSWLFGLAFSSADVDDVFDLFSHVVSTICTVVLVLLAITEIRTYVSPSTSSMITIQSSHESDKFHINIDVVMPYMPCDVIGLTLEDSMNNKVTDYYGELHKHRLSSDGEELSIETWEEK